MADMIWRGSRDLHELPDSPQRSRDRDGLTITRVFTGPYQDLVDNEPEVDAAMEGFPTGILVRNVTTVPLEAGPDGPGRMTVIADDKSGTTEVGSLNPEPTYETEWVQLEKSIKSHPYFEALTTDEINAVEAAIEERTSYSGSELAESYYAKLLRGQENYLLFSPVIRATTALTSKPSNTSAGGRETPPSAAAVPDGYEWLKTASRAVTPGQDSKWELVEEWTAADEWDDDIYPE